MASKVCHMSIGGARATTTIFSIVFRTNSWSFCWGSEGSGQSSGASCPRYLRKSWFKLLLNTDVENLHERARKVVACQQQGVRYPDSTGHENLRHKRVIILWENKTDLQGRKIMSWMSSIG